MVRVIKFPLILNNKIEVRTIEELKENFDLESIVAYFLNGKLKIWLQQRNYINELESVIKLQDSSNKEDIAKKLCEIFNVQVEDNIDIEEIKRKKEREKKLLQYTDDETWKEKLDYIAFTQEELDNNLLSCNFDKLAKEKETYLCGEEFVITDEYKDITYTGVNKCLVILKCKEKRNFNINKIKFNNVKLKHDGDKSIKQDYTLNPFEEDVILDKETIIKNLKELIDKLFIIEKQLTKENIKNFSLEKSRIQARKTFSKENKNLPYYHTDWVSENDEEGIFEQPKDMARKLEEFYNKEFKNICIYYKDLSAQEVIAQYKQLKNFYKNMIDKINDEIAKKLVEYNQKEIKHKYLSLDFTYTEFYAKQRIKKVLGNINEFNTVVNIERKIFEISIGTSVWKTRIREREINNYIKSATRDLNHIETRCEQFVLKEINEVIPNKIKENLKSQIKKIITDMNN